MTSESERTVCVSCNKEKLTYVCGGCLKRYCLHDLTRHRADLTQQLDQIQNDHDQLRQNLIDDKSNAIKHPSIERIDQWEKYSIEKIKEIAQQWRDKWMDYSNHSLGKIEKKLNDLAKQIEDIHRENEFSETDLNFLNLKLRELCELHRSTDVLVERKSTALINNIHLRLPIWKGKYGKVKYRCLKNIYPIENNRIAFTFHSFRFDSVSIESIFENAIFDFPLQFRIPCTPIFFV